MRTVVCRAAALGFYLAHALEQEGKRALGSRP